MELGVRKSTVRIVPYQQEWNDVFLLEKKILSSICDKYALAIEHIGSTAIKELQAKPIIDIAVKVANIEIIQSIEVKLKAIGYTEIVNRLEGPQRVFRKMNDDLVTHHLHIIQADCPEWNRKLLFRDYLRTHAEARQEYEELKLSLMKLFSNMRGVYTEMKKGFINSVIEKAEKDNK